MPKHFSSDPITKTHRLWHYDESSDTAVIETRQDVSACVELTRSEFAMMDERAPWKGDQHHVARIPLSEVEQLMVSGVWFDDKALKKWLNDKDNRAFRVRPGVV